MKKLAVILLSVTAVFAGPPDPSRTPELSFPATTSYRGIQFYKEEPTAHLRDQNTLVLNIDTLVEAPAGTLYYGHIHPNQNFPYPRLRFRASESTEDIKKDWKKNHSFQIPLNAHHYKSPEKFKYDPGRLRDHGGVLALEFNFYNQKKKAADIYQTSLRYFKDENGQRSLQTHILSGPYYDTSGAGSASISMDLNQRGSGKVILRRPGSSRVFTRTFDSKNPVIHFHGLKEGARYEYQVQLANMVDEKVHSYYSYPAELIRIPSANFTPFSFACMSDSRSGHGIGEIEMQGTNSKSIKQLFRMAYDRGAQFIFFPGDLVDGYNTVPADFYQQMFTWKKASTPVHRKIPVFEGMGNHEAIIQRYVVPKSAKVQPVAYGNFSFSLPNLPTENVFSNFFVNPSNGPDSEGYNTPKYGETVYSIVLNGSAFIMLNTNYWYSSDPETVGGNLEGYIMDRQMEWFEEQIKSFNKRRDVKHIFVFAHEPAYPNSVHYTDAMYYNNGEASKNGGFDRKWVVERRDRFWKAASSSGKTAFVMFGDEHNYSRCTIPANPEKGFKHDLTQLISGGVGAPYYSEVDHLPWSKHVDFVDWKQNYVFTQVKKDRVIIQAISSTGEIMDQVEVR